LNNTALDAVRPITPADVQAARQRISGTVLRTPLVRLDLGAGFPDIRVKLENLQPTNSYKLRGAANAVAMLSTEQRAKGIWTISAGNAGQGVAYAGRAAGIPCTVVAIETAPTAKLERMRALGAKVITVSYDAAWRALGERRYAGVDGTFVHPFDDDDFIAGHATMGYEILEDVPDAVAVFGGIGGGGLITGLGSALKALQPGIEIWGVEPETAAPAAQSFAQGSPQVFGEWQASFVDGAGGKSMFPRMWSRMRPVVNGSVVVRLDEVRRAMRLLAEKTRVVAEGAGALSLAAALRRQPGEGPIVAVVSGGNIDLDKFCELIGP
jgi:threonine dehydratase